MPISTVAKSKQCHNTCTNYADYIQK